MIFHSTYFRRYLRAITRVANHASGSFADTPTLPHKAGHFIAGVWSTPRGDSTRTNPARPLEEVTAFDAATRDEVEAGVAAAREAYGHWRTVPIIERARVLRDAAKLVEARADALAFVVTVEEGKTLAEAKAEVLRTAETFYYHSSHAWSSVGDIFASSAPGEEVRTVRVPLGVVGVITPWNFPLLIPAWKIAPAILWGNAVVWKPASHTTGVAAYLVEILAEAGVPDGVLNLVAGPASTGEALVQGQVDAITFTGSRAVGYAIRGSATPRGLRVQLELGGHNPAVICSDADIDLAARHVAAGAMLSAGQKCTATRRIITLPSIHDEFVTRLIAEVEHLTVGDGLDPNTNVGPLISQSALDDVAREVELAIGQGATTLTGGSVASQDHLARGHFFEPTVLSTEESDIRICHEEVFGPVTTVLTAESEEEAFSLANATDYGLSAAVFTNREATIRRALLQLDVGLICINRPTTGSEIHAPFGGMKGSSSPAPREQGDTARDFYTELKTAYLFAR